MTLRIWLWRVSLVILLVATLSFFTQVAYADVSQGTTQCSSSDPAQCQQASPSPTPTSSASSSGSSSPSPQPSAASTQSSGGSADNGILGFFAGVWASLSSIVSIILGAILNPLGAINGIICRVIDAIASVWPSTPDNLKIASILLSISKSIPNVGYGVLLDIAQTIGDCFLLFVVIKVYKLIPFKMS